ncbi:NAD(P)H-dependent flavin oxidoreductase [Xylanibacter caecicola]|uniref:NAD(P)H-dependent flavin oxidoreductase n=1 Tax=Xylanibacter caecicola TaxID=2736294 RepID=UPI00258CA73B|nr:nitronate monooxygenase [Xylanibacter caecicola]
MNNRITRLFGIKYPIIQGGMVWCSGWRLASAVSNAGGLGLLGAGSMHPETLVEHICKMKDATDKPWGVNVPLMYPEIERLMQIIISEGVKVVFTSAGSPKKFTPMLHDAGIKVAHVVSGSRFALKCQEAGVDAVVAEGFEAGGHNGREETTTFTLIPQVRRSISMPLIAAGGVASGSAMLAAEALGAEGVQIGTLFALSRESSASEEFKDRCVGMDEGGTMLCLKKLSPTRLVKNSLYERIAEAEARGASADELRDILGRAASKRGIFEGDTVNGELEIGQVASYIKEVRPVSEIMETLVFEYKECKDRIIKG